MAPSSVNKTAREMEISLALSLALMKIISLVFRLTSLLAHDLDIETNFAMEMSLELR